MARKSRKGAVQPKAQAERQCEERVWKCAVYTRLSKRDNGVETGDSIRTQANYVCDYVERHTDLELVGVFEDNGRTGTTFEGRVEFDRLMDEVRAGTVDCIAVKDLSRFGRNMYETSTFLERIFPFMGVRFIAVNDGLDTFRGDGGIAVPFKGLVNELYARQVSRMVGTVKDRMMDDGLVTHGAAPYGYRIAEDGHKVEPDGRTAPYVPMMFEWYLDGERLCDIASKLTDMGAPTLVEHLADQYAGGYDAPHDDRGWTGRTVAKVLDNPVCAGVLELGKTRQSLADGIEWHRTGEDEKRVFEDAHEAIVASDVFEAVRAMRRDEKALKRKRVAARGRQRDEMPDEFKGILVCAECGGAMVINRRFNPKSGEARGSIYQCRHSHGRGCENRVRIPVPCVRTAVMDAIRLQVSCAVRFEAVLPGVLTDGRVKERRAALGAAVAAARGRADALAERRRALYEDYADGRIDLVEYKQAKRAAADALSRCQEELEQTLAARDAFEASLTLDDGFSAAVAALEDVDTFSRELLVALVDRVKVDSGGGLEVVFKFRDWAEQSGCVGEVLA